MGLQNQINMAMGSMLGAGFGLSKINSKQKTQQKTQDSQLTLRQTQANKKAKQIQEAKKVQSERYENKLLGLKTSLGIKIGDFPPHVQQKIISQFSPQEKLELINKEKLSNGKK